MTDTATPLNVAILWHQHQPYYRISRGVHAGYRMPWVRLHAVKDYYDIPALLQHYPSIQQNFNLVPSLLVQLEDYVTHRRTDEVIDLTLRHPGDLSPEDRKAMLSTFFLANTKNLIEPQPRYRELLKKRNHPDAFTWEDWLDLQVWYNLAWVGESWKTQEPFRSLIEKQRSFSQEDKEALIAGHYDIMAQVIPLYRELCRSDRIELSVTPYYHPILPLLCDSDIAVESSPSLTKPDVRFQHPEDAQLQIRRAVEYYRSLFERNPGGMWPSEGSVSTEALELIRQEGIRWVATDEEILSHSLLDSPADRYRPYRLDTRSGPIDLLFRDHALSDAIGFSYAAIEAKTAVSDFMHRIERIRSDLVNTGRDPAEQLLCVILDGENCWEYYPRNGQDFLNGLYSELSKSRRIRTTTISAFLEETDSSGSPRPRIRRLHPGSWINHNFNIWIGRHVEKNTAWKFLKETRDFLAQRTPTDDATQAWEEIYICEGSDWFWWYGDDHQAENKHEFDELFRYHLRRVYEWLGEEPPVHLHEPIMQRSRVPEVFRQPTALLQPSIDGVVSHYYEWLDAGVYESRADSDAMHMADPWIARVYYGFDDQHLFLRVDFDEEKRVSLGRRGNFLLQLRFFRAADLCLEIAVPLRRGSAEGEGYVAFFKDILEVRLSRNRLPSDQRHVGLLLSLWRGDREIVRRPSRDYLTIDFPEQFFDKYAWSV